MPFALMLPCSAAHSTHWSHIARQASFEIEVVLRVGFKDVCQVVVVSVQ